jgi:hypothetical protein
VAEVVTDMQMDMKRHTALVLAGGLLLVGAGCLGSGP